MTNTLLMSPNPNVARNQVADIELAARAATGDETAFGELYRRNVAAAWRIAQAVTVNREDASDAVGAAFVRALQSPARGRLESDEQFRPYLLATTRRAAVDLLRKAGRLPRDAAEAADASLDIGDGDAIPTIDAALRSLPERWRAAAWLAEVEGLDAPDMAPIFGLSADAASQMTARATTALRERYLQLSLQTDVDQVCRLTAERLGTYVSAGVSGREADKLDRHLANCPACATRLDDLKDLGASLRETMVPIPLSLAALTMSRWRVAFGSLTPTRRRAGMAPFGSATRPIAIGAAALAALGIVGATIWGQPRHPSPTAPRVALAAPALATPATIVVTPQDATPAAAAGSPASPGVVLAASISPTTRLARPATASGGTTTRSASTPPTTRPVAGPTPTTPASPPVPGTVPPLPTTLPPPLPTTVPGTPTTLPVTVPTRPATLPTLPVVTAPTLP
jgi:RNA polymerase sigma factor (sigma-70 family)